MLASTRNALARSGAAPATRVAARRTALPRHARFQWTVTQQAQSAVKASEGAASSGAASHAAAGIAGGLTVLLGGYVYYRSSSLATAVDSAQATKVYLQQTKDSVAKSVQESVGDKSATDVIKYLRGIASSYVVMIPGASSYIDSVFDQLQTVADKHGDKATEILNGAYDEVQGVYTDAKKKGTVDAEIAMSVADILRRRLAELYELGKEAGGDAIQTALDKNPQLKEKLGGGYEQLVKLAEEKGPEARKQVEDVQKQLQEIFSKGFSASAATQAYTLVQDKVEELRKLAEPAAQEAWDKSIETAKPYLDKLPEVKDLLNEKSGLFLSLGAGALGGSSSKTKEMFDRIKSVAEASGKEREQQLTELKDYIMKKAQEATGGASGVLGIGWDQVQQYVKKVPGGEEMLKKVPNAQALLSLSADRGEEATKLAKETWEDVLKVLEEKGQKAKKLAESTKEEAKDKAKK